MFYKIQILFKNLINKQYMGEQRVKGIGFPGAKVFACYSLHQTSFHSVSITCLASNIYYS